jgi:hypothetical protein
VIMSRIESWSNESNQSRTEIHSVRPPPFIRFDRFQLARAQSKAFPPFLNQ